MIVDGHLDLGFTALYEERDLRRPVAELREPGAGRAAMVSFPAMAAGGVGLVLGTVFAEPATTWIGTGVGLGMATARPVRTYATPEQAQEQALEMLAVYHHWALEGTIRIVTSRAGLAEHLRRFPVDGVVGVVLIMEGADPILAPDQLDRWWRRGIRSVGLAWSDTRYAGGTGSRDGLSPAGRELVAALAEQGMIHDASHLSEQAFWEAAGLPHHALCATHAAARTLMASPPGRPSRVPLNRHLSDEQLREIARPRGAAAGGGIIGLPLLNLLLEPDGGGDGRPVEVRVDRQVRAQLHHLGATVGWSHVGIGSDVDAGLGRDDSPVELDSIADWSAVGGVVPADVREQVLGGNWLRFLREALPAR